MDTNTALVIVMVAILISYCFLVWVITKSEQNND